LHSQEGSFLKKAAYSVRFRIMLFAWIFSIVLYVSVPAPAVFAQKEGSLAWLSLEEGIAKAGEENKLILVDVYTDWCHWCKEMDKQVYADSAVIQYIIKNFVPVKFDAESENRVMFQDRYVTQRTLSYEMGITSYPTTLFLKSDGTPITRLPGFVPPLIFRDVIEYIHSGAYANMGFEDWQKRKIKK